MATIAELENALRNADAAGAMEDARVLAAALVQARKDNGNFSEDAQIMGIGPQVKKPGVRDTIVGTGEAALSTVTGLTGGLVGMVGGGISGGIQSIKDGTFGTPEGNKLAEQTAAIGAQRYTYAPRTQSGQDQIEVVGKVAQQLLPIAPIAGGFAGMTQALKPPVVQAVDAVRIGGPMALQAGKQAANRATGAIKSTGARLGMGEAVEAPMNTGGGMVSGGAAAVNPLNQTLATVAKSSPDLRMTVEKLVKKGIEIDQEVLARHVEADSLMVPIKYTEGQVTRNPQLFSNEKNMRGKNVEYQERFAEQNQQLIDNVNALREKVAPDVYTSGNTAHAETLMNAYLNLDEGLKRVIRADYKALEDANGGIFPLDAKTFVLNAEANLNKANRNRFLPSEIRGILDDYKNGEQMTFNNFEELRTILSAESRKVERAGDGNKKMAISAVRNALEDLPMPKGMEHLKPLADKARNSSKARFDLLKADPAYNAVVRGTALPDRFIQKYVINGDSTKLHELMYNLRDDPVAQQTVAASMVDHLKASARITDDSGVFAQASYNKAAGNLSPKFNIVFKPDEIRQIQKTGNVARNIKEAPDGHTVNSSNTYVAELADSKAGRALEGVANVAAHGVPVGTWVKNALMKNADKKAIQKSLRTGAGIVKTKEAKLKEVKAKVLAAKAAKEAQQNPTNNP